MTCLKPSRPETGSDPTLHTLAHPLSTQTLMEIEHAFITALSILGREMYGVGLGMAPELALQPSEAAECEYASWLPSPGALEVASWASHLRASAH